MGGGNATKGIVAGHDDTHATHTAPDKAPSPDTVSVSAFIGNTAEFNNVTVVSQVKIIGTAYHGTFTLRRTGRDGAAYMVKGEADLDTFLSDSNGSSFDMKGTITIDSTIGWNGLTCTCTDDVTKPIPDDAVFAIQRKPSLAQRWVMPGRMWNFRCDPGGVSIPFGAARSSLTIPSKKSREKILARPSPPP